MSFKAELYFTAEAIRLARYFISQNDGNEIVMVGRAGSDGKVCDLRRAAMGDAGSVPAVIATAQPGEILIHNHPSGNVNPSAADIEVAAHAAEKSIGSYIVDNDVINIFPVVERIEPENTETEPVDLDEVAEIFSRNGRLAQSDTSFEFRQPQTEMALSVAEAINFSSVLVAEAGTGTGKSFAYLVPAMLYVSKNKGKRVVISTSTIALQEQLFNKDIPALLKKLDIGDIGTVVLKGRSNYLCKRRYAAFRMGSVQTKIDDDASQKTLETVEEIDRWLNYTDDGSRSNMNSAVSLDIWNEICADELACEKSKCRFFSSCFFFKARRRANFASLILVNHHLLMADVSMKSAEDEGEGILPKFDILVIDEAHNIFKSAVSFLGESVSSNSVRKLLGKLYNTNSGQGLLTRILSNNANSALLKPLEKAVNILSGGFQAKFAHSFLPELISILGRNSDETLFELDDPEKRKEMTDILGKIVTVVTDVTDLIAPVVKLLKEKDDAHTELRTVMDDMNRSLITDLEGVVAKLASYAGFYSEFCIGTNTENQVFWGEKSGETLTLTISPLEVQRILAENLYKDTKSIVFTSATLTTSRDAHGFDFFYRESGLALSEREKKAVSLESCFDYASQIKAFIGGDMPDPARDRELFDSASIDAAHDIVKASGGGALVLFTSISHREAALKYFSDLDFEVISQGKLPVQAIMKKFREDVNATLLATETFWEGIDMKGDTLRNLVIVKLPFRFPSHPFIKRYVARLEQETGKGGFQVYTLPNAVLKFKQGFGRLIRTKSDIGTVTVLDKRIAEKNYGRDFIRSAPAGVKFNVLPVAEIARRVEEFFGRND
ncbi:DEAD/DEAH box helicase [bacterium]|nr:DEAD/DEAH box helicase [bacterium]